MRSTSRRCCRCSPRWVVLLAVGDPGCALSLSLLPPLFCRPRVLYIRPLLSTRAAFGVSIQIPSLYFVAASPVCIASCLFQLRSTAPTDTLSLTSARNDTTAHPRFGRHLLSAARTARAAYCSSFSLSSSARPLIKQTRPRSPSSRFIDSRFFPTARPHHSRILWTRFASISLSATPGTPCQHLTSRGSRHNCLCSSPFVPSVLSWFGSNIAHVHAHVHTHVHTHVHHSVWSTPTPLNPACAPSTRRSVSYTTPIHPRLSPFAGLPIVPAIAHFSPVLCGPAGRAPTARLRQPFHTPLYYYQAPSSIPASLYAPATRSALAARHAP